MIRNVKNKDLLIWTYRPSGSRHGDSVHSPSRFRCDRLCCSGHPAVASGYQPLFLKVSSKLPRLWAASSSNLSCVDILAALAYHVVVGIRRMMMDFAIWKKHSEAIKRSAKSPLLLLSCFHFAGSSYGRSNASALGRNGVHDFISSFVLRYRPDALHHLYGRFSLPVAS